MRDGRRGGPCACAARGGMAAAALGWRPPSERRGRPAPAPSGRCGLRRAGRSGPPAIGLPGRCRGVWGWRLSTGSVTSGDMAALLGRCGSGASAAHGPSLPRARFHPGWCCQKAILLYYFIFFYPADTLSFMAQVVLTSPPQPLRKVGKRNGY